MNLKQRLLAEFLGTAGLLIVVVGSGIMGETLAQGNMAIALLANSIATGAGLYVLIQTFGETSGAHFNPVVSLVELLQKKLSTRDFTFYVMAQVVGAVIGVWLTHFMFGQKILQLSTHDRGDFRFFVSEIIATFGLISVIFLSVKNKSNTALIVAMYITAAYWFTSSTSFANPAVTIARSLTDTFSGIQYHGVSGFITAQVAGSLLAYGLIKFFENSKS